MAKAKKSTASTLEPWQVEDARRLRALFKANWSGSQAEFGAQFGLGTQGHVWQLLNAVRPLNVNALITFARGLGVQPQDISPRLTREIEEIAASRGAGPELANWEMFPVDAAAHPVKVMSSVEPDESGSWEKATDSGPGGFVNVPSNDPKAFAIRVLGDQLQPRIRPGEFIVMEPGHVVKPGDEVLVRTGKRWYVREYLFTQNGNVVLCSVNGGHGRHTLAEKDVIEMIYIAAIVKSQMAIEPKAAHK